MHCNSAFFPKRNRTFWNNGFEAGPSPHGGRFSVQDEGAGEARQTGDFFSLFSFIFLSLFSSSLRKRKREPLSPRMCSKFFFQRSNLQRSFPPWMSARPSLKGVAVGGSTEIWVDGCWPRIPLPLQQTTLLGECIGKPRERSALEKFF